MGNGWVRDKEEVKRDISYLIQESLDAVWLWEKMCMCVCVLNLIIRKFKQNIFQITRETSIGQNKCGARCQKKKKIKWKRIKNEESNVIIEKITKQIACQTWIQW